MLRQSQKLFFEFSLQKGSYKNVSLTRAELEPAARGLTALCRRGLRRRDLMKLAAAMHAEKLAAERDAVYWLQRKHLRARVDPQLPGESAAQFYKQLAAALPGERTGLMAAVRTMLTPIKVGRIDSLSDPARCLLLLLVDGGNLRRGAVFAPRKSKSEQVIKCH